MNTTMELMNDDNDVHDDNNDDSDDIVAVAIITIFPISMSNVLLMMVFCMHCTGL